MQTIHEATPHQLVGRPRGVRGRTLGRRCGLAACATLLLTASAQAQHLPRYSYPTENLSGPRFGVTMLSQGNLEALAEQDIVVRPLVSQFGWQFERRVYTNGNGLTALTEWVPLVTGLEQGYALPSLNWLVGVRTAQGTEFGLGPNITPAGIGLVITAGVTVRSGALNIPMNFAVTTSESGMRVTLLTGFNLRR